MITVFVYSAQFTVIEEMAMQHWRLCIQNKGADKGFPETIQQELSYAFVT